jgi:hypothetical protein
VSEVEELKLNIEQLEKRIAPGLTLGGGLCVDVNLQLGGGGNGDASGGCDSGSGSGSHGSNDDNEDNSCSS